jgi:hypothetical protein
VKNTPIDENDIRDNMLLDRMRERNSDHDILVKHIARCTAINVLVAAVLMSIAPAIGVITWVTITNAAQMSQIEGSQIPSIQRSLERLEDKVGQQHVDGSAPR